MYVKRLDGISGFGLLAPLLFLSPPIPLELPVRSLVRICGGARCSCLPSPRPSILFFFFFFFSIYFALPRTLNAYPHPTVYIFKLH